MKKTAQSARDVISQYRNIAMSWDRLVKDFEKVRPRIDSMRTEVYKENDYQSGSELDGLAMAYKLMMYQSWPVAGRPFWPNNRPPNNLQEMYFYKGKVNEFINSLNNFLAHLAGAANVFGGKKSMFNSHGDTERMLINMGQSQLHGQIQTVLQTYVAVRNAELTPGARVSPYAGEKDKSTGAPGVGTAKPKAHSQDDKEIWVDKNFRLEDEVPNYILTTDDENGKWYVKDMKTNEKSYLKIEDVRDHIYSGQLKKIYFSDIKNYGLEHSIYK